MCLKIIIHSTKSVLKDLLFGIVPYLFRFRQVNKIFPILSNRICKLYKQSRVQCVLILSMHKAMRSNPGNTKIHDIWNRNLSSAMVWSNNSIKILVSVCLPVSVTYLYQITWVMKSDHTCQLQVMCFAPEKYNNVQKDR